MYTDENKNMKEIVIETKNADSEPTRRRVEADKVLMAVGAVPSTRIPRTTSGIEVDEKGYLLTRDVPYGMTSRKGVFAGGDVANRQATVVHAMRDAKMVAEGIAQYIDAVKLMEMIG
ncbi:MAG: FAD-dependent oxidoreductase [Bacteroidales bacterium]|nr:FAD-dependent oxidoreductase [Bacteroidales bacterium]